jgi:2-polyprenyl-6-methoxyphenol hydroxylase-like FAD-dependent oxidoreductase
MSERVDVVIVGAGIAGSALAAALAEHGTTVTVLERQEDYRDLVRGEVINCWGVAEAKELGLEEPLLRAGGTYVNRFVGYDETVDPETASANALPLDDMVPGIAGVLDVGHPEACQALATAAVSAGATIIRGVANIEVLAGPHPRVTYQRENRRHDISCRLIVGADGRNSAVRRRLGIHFTRTPPNSWGGGILAGNLDGWPVNVTSIGAEGDLMYFVFPRSDLRARLYLLHDVRQRGRFTGPDRDRAFLDAFRLKCIPNSEMFLDAKPLRSCAFYPMDDAWAEAPAVPGAVLVGDAAGWSDPVVGQGLAVAFRDARMVRDLCLNNTHWDSAMFEPYAKERALRMDRLRLSGKVRTAMFLTFTDAGRSRRRTYARMLRQDPLLAGSRLATFKGPHGVPPESFEPEVIDRILALE